jgi:hypothetical protein
MSSCMSLYWDTTGIICVLREQVPTTADTVKVLTRRSCEYQFEVELQPLALVQMSSHGKVIHTN